ncbi:hypothetical protein [Bartonella doshiae]|uniref:Uncharacterized protein n=2 Tax=Bartonella doshiae TaxID=33044 RepID=A0A380ZDD1_BARDO|nr:hypothetical protein [Bartonella doshiae]EJF82149.1 hypothetical protein MCS_00070 [Bartonella doshiae NCTC 12862 = ATCC 700133]MBB6160149.1 hypothetical protein [Bartonella doshiae]SUV44947.1 Uncharacterised protein [Bartonella doshiae]
MAEVIPPLINRKNTRVIGHISDYTPEQLQELFAKNKERLSGSVTGNNGATEEDGPHPSAAGAFGWGALHGLTMGYDDEIAGVFASGPLGPINYWMGDEEAVKKYNEVTKRWRDYQRAANRDQFYLSLAGNLAGAAAPVIASALFPPAAGATAAARAAIGADVVLGGRAGVAGAQITSKALAAGERAVQSALAEGAERAAAKAAGEAAMKAVASKEAAKFSLGRAAKAGAIYGGIAGSGEGEGLADTLVSAGLGAGLGVATPFVASGVSKVTPFVTKSLKAALRGPISPAEMAAKAALMPEKEAFQISDRALRDVSQTLGDEGVDKLERALKQRGPDSMIIDLHDGLATRAFKAAKKDHDTYSLISNRLNERQDASALRVKDALTDVMGPKVDTLNLKQEIIKQAQKKAEPFYERAKASPISNAVSKDLSRLQETPAFQKAYKKAIAQMQNEADATVIGSNGYPKLNMRILHKMKEVLDDQIKSARIKGKWGYARDLTDFKQRILDVLDTSSPDYAKARKIYYDERTIGDALEQGKQALKKSVNLDTINSQLSGFGLMEKEAFQKGMRSQIEDAAGNAQNFEHSLLSLFDTKNGQEKLRQSFGEDKAKQLMKVLRPEVERTKLFARLPNHMGEVEEKTIEQAVSVGKIGLIKAAMKTFAREWGRKLSSVNKDTERDIAALITAREKGDFGLAREKAVELIKKFHEAEKKRLITKEDHTKFFNFIGIILNSSADRTVIN